MCKQYIVLVLALVAFLNLSHGAPIDEDYVIEEDSLIEDTNNGTGEGEKCEVLSIASVLPKEDENVSQMTGSQELFKKFCSEAREHVESKLLTEQDRLKSTIFNVIFTSGQNLLAEMLNSEGEAIQQLTQQLKDPKPVEEQADSDDKIQKIIDEGAKGIHDRVNKCDLLSSANTVIRVMFAKANQVLNEQAEKLKSFFSVEKLAMINDGCGKFKKEYLDVVGNLFKQHRGKLMEAAKKDKVTPVIDSLNNFNRMDNLNCGVTKRLLKVRQFCNFHQTASHVVMNMMAAMNNNDY